MINIKYLKDCSEHIPLIASWIVKEGWIKSQEKSESILLSCLNKDRIALAFVALETGAPVGMVALKEWESLYQKKNFPERKPWLSSFYVLPQFRKKGVGSRLYSIAVRKANELGYRKIYLYTHTAEKYYIKNGWKYIGSFEEEKEENMVFVLLLQ